MTEMTETHIGEMYPSQTEENCQHIHVEVKRLLREAVFEAEKAKKIKASDQHGTALDSIVDKITGALKVAKDSEGCVNFYVYNLSTRCTLTNVKVFIIMCRPKSGYMSLTKNKTNYYVLIF